jgi:hypothetical protein
VIAACAAPGPAAPSGPGSTVGPEATDVSAEQVGENLMSALRDGRTTAAWEIVSTGLAAKKFSGEAGFVGKMIAAGTPASWTFEPLKYDSGDSGSVVVLEGAVTFEDGDTGHVRIEMQAFGLQANPWRVNAFSLTDE